METSRLGTQNSEHSFDDTFVLQYVQTGKVQCKHTGGHTGTSPGLDLELLPQEGSNVSPERSCTGFLVTLTLLHVYCIGGMTLAACRHVAEICDVALNCLRYATQLQCCVFMMQLLCFCVLSVWTF